MGTDYNKDLLTYLLLETAIRVHPCKAYRKHHPGNVLFDRTNWQHQTCSRLSRLVPVYVSCWISSHSYIAVFITDQDVKCVVFMAHCYSRFTVENVRR